MPASKTKKGRKIGRNKVKCEKYRARIGKPRGPGKPGNKIGKGRSLTNRKGLL